jgi:divalent metal cation (Fe/Co/Zn/Cd) transporter
MDDTTTATVFEADDERRALVRRGLWLVWLTVAYNLVEAGLSLTASYMAGSVALLAFGVDSSIEMLASSVALWRLYSDADHARREHSERVARRVIGFSFVALAAYVAYQALEILWVAEAPASSRLGILVAAAAVVVMPVLARAKTRVALAMKSGALHLEATQTMLCTYLSAILLGGLLLNATLGWWWADPLAALAMSPIIAREGWDAIRGRTCPCCDS